MLTARTRKYLYIIAGAIAIHVPVLFYPTLRDGSANVYGHL